MSSYRKQGWEALKTAKSGFLSWATVNHLNVARVEHVATFEEWDNRTEIYIFFPTDIELEHYKLVGGLPDIEAKYREFLSGAQYPSERFPVVFYFDSHENVVRNYQGSYFYRLR